MANGPLPFAVAVEELAQRRAAGETLAILDVREPWELEICRIADSVEIPLGRLPAALGRIPRDRPLVVLCHHGMRSGQATLWLRANGVANAVNLEGGIDAWARRIDASMRVY